MKLIVGLGNPGKEYENTRHNCGFSTLNKYADKHNLLFNEKGFKGEYCKTKINNEVVYLLKPMTYMNLSGECVQEFVHYFKINVSDILVVYDDLALNPGVIRIRKDGSSGGQKGMQNIIDNLSTQLVKRIRIGIGEPKFNTVDYVLGKPNKEEQELINKAIDRACDAIDEFIISDFNKVISKFSGGGNG